MLNIERALKQDRLLRALTGLNRKAFDALLPTFSTVYEQSLLEQPRRRAIGGGRKARLRTAQDKLLSQSRVVCENAFAGMKRYNAVSAVYRNRRKDFDDHLMLTAAGLWNFYLMAA